MTFVKKLLYSIRKNQNILIITGKELLYQYLT